MPAKGSSKNPNYLGLDERGYPMWMGSCGHPVYGRKTQFCQRCFGIGRQTRPNNAGKQNGRSVYTAGCGHLVKNWGTQRCANCRAAGRHKKYDGGWYKMVRPRGLDGKRGKLIAEHTMIAEQTLGRKLKPNEMVHHLNMDKTDNRRCNLLICTRDYHRFLHVQMERYCAARIRGWQDAQGA
jgi:hypothetical protein